MLAILTQQFATLLGLPVSRAVLESRSQPLGVSLSNPRPPCPKNSERVNAVTIVTQCHRVTNVPLTCPVRAWETPCRFAGVARFHSTYPPLLRGHDFLEWRATILSVCFPVHWTYCFALKKEIIIVDYINKSIETRFFNWKTCAPRERWDSWLHFFLEKKKI